MIRFARQEIDPPAADHLFHREVPADLSPGPAAALHRVEGQVTGVVTESEVSGDPVPTFLQRPVEVLLPPDHRDQDRLRFPLPGE